ncbi:MAG: glycosyltransferase family 4 protein [Flavobacteriaceae bacterium]|nr:glycosyltransferase family 4 protein [Flavobacteriaceae bacterium]
MKVCHIISGYYRIDARVFQRQCKSLQKDGYDVSILTNDGEPEDIIEGIVFYSCEKVYQSRIKTLLSATKQFYKKAKGIDADVYQLHSPELFSLGLKLKKLGKKVIYDAHEDLPRHIQEKEWLPKIIRKPLSIIVEWYMNYSLSKFDFIITPHSHVLLDLKNKVKNIELIANFPIVKESHNFTLEEYLKRENIICYTGTVYSYSNQELLGRIVSNFKDLKYNIAGYMDDNLLKKLKTMILKSKFKFHGRIPFNQLPIFYNQATIGYVLYDYKLNLGYKLGSYGTNKIFEYMEEGLPFICTDYTLWKDICNNYNCGIFIPPGDENKLKEALTFLITNKEQAYKMGQNGKKAVKDIFNWTSEERKYLKIFENI